MRPQYQEQVEPYVDDFTKLLLHFNGVHATTQFIDSSQATPSKLVTAGSAAKISTTQSYFGGSAGYFAGTTDYIISPSHADFTFEAEFCIDFWLRRDTTQPGTSERGILEQNRYNTTGITMTENGSNIFIWYNSSSRITGTLPAANTWTHIALLRTGTTLKLFINGTQSGSDYTLSGTITCHANGIAIMNRHENLALYGEAGYMDELRISKGTSRWTTTFTPATERYDPDVYTKLLLHFNGANNSTTFVDSPFPNPSPKVVTANGNAMISTSQFKFGGSSGYFDGSGDYLTSPFTDEFGTSDFTIAFWYWKDGANNDNGGISFRDASYGFGEIFDMIFVNGKLRLSCGAGISSEYLQSSSPSDSAWHHFAFVRNGTTAKAYTDGTETYSKTGWTDTLPTPTIMNIGQESTVAPGSMFKGYMDELQVSIGIARWIANFTPPTRPHGVPILAGGN